MWSEAGPGTKCETHTHPAPKAKRVDSVVQVLEHLPSKCKALSSNSSTSEK
jgi:hypothetical protein